MSQTPQYPGQPPTPGPQAPYGYPAAPVPPTPAKKPIVKRWWFWLLAVIVVIVAVNAMGKDDTDPAGGSAAPATSSAASAPAGTASSQAPASKRDFAVTIDGSAQAKDYEGKPALVVNYTFTNNSDKPDTFMWAIQDQAFQNGVELERAVIVDEKVLDSAGATKEIKPGATVKVQQAYLLDGTSDVTIEVTELISFNDTPLATATISVK